MRAYFGWFFLECVRMISVFHQSYESYLYTWLTRKVKYFDPCLIISKWPPFPHFEDFLYGSVYWPNCPIKNILGWVPRVQVTFPFKMHQVGYVHSSLSYINACRVNSNTLHSSHNRWIKSFFYFTTDLPKKNLKIKSLITVCTRIKNCLF